MKSFLITLSLVLSAVAKAELPSENNSVANIGPVFFHTLADCESAKLGRAVFQVGYTYEPDAANEEDVVGSARQNRLVVFPKHASEYQLSNTQLFPSPLNIDQEFAGVINDGAKDVSVSARLIISRTDASSTNYSGTLELNGESDSVFCTQPE